MDADALGEIVVTQMRFEPRAVDRVGLEGIDPSGWRNPFRGQEREVPEVSADIDEPTATFDEAAEHAIGVELVEADGHVDVGIGAKVEVESKAIGGLENSFALGFGNEMTGEAGEAIAAALGGSDARPGFERSQS